MRFLLLLCTMFLLVTKNYGQDLLTEISINHVPIVVANLEKTKSIFSTLGFKIKEGRKHVGINNFFIKFGDGTYLEFIVPLDSSHRIGKYYSEFLKQRQGPATLAIDIKNTDKAKKYLSSKKINFESDSNIVWRTISPKLKYEELFFIEYADKIWKDSRENTTHINGALQLNSTWILSNNIKKDIEKYAKLGFFKETKLTKFGSIVYSLSVGKNKMNLIDASTANNLKSQFINKNFEGICGFTIKVSSLEKMKKLLETIEKSEVVFEKNHLILFFSEYNFFIEFIQ